MNVEQYIEKIRRNDPSLTEIHLQYEGLTDAAIMPLMQALADNQASAQRIKTLDLSDNKLTSIDVSFLSGLTKLKMSSNKLQVVDLSALSLLTDLDLGNNLLINVNIAHLGRLNELQLWQNQLVNIDLPTTGTLETLGLNGNQLNQIDLSHQTSLKWLNLNYNQLNSINLTSLVNLNMLAIANNQLVNMDLPSPCALTELFIDSNPWAAEEEARLSALAVQLRAQKLPAAERNRLIVDGLIHRIVNNDQSLRQINYSSFTNNDPNVVRLLIALRMHPQVTNNIKVFDLSCNFLTSINLDNFSSLKRLCLRQNQLKTINILKLPSLTELDLQINEFTDATKIALNCINSLRNNSIRMWYHSVHGERQETLQALIPSPEILENHFVSTDPTSEELAAHVRETASIMALDLPNEIKIQISHQLLPTMFNLVDIADFKSIFKQHDPNFDSAILDRRMRGVANYTRVLCNSSKMQSISDLNSFVRANQFNPQDLRQKNPAGYTPLALAMLQSRELKTNSNNAVFAYKVDNALVGLIRRNKPS